MPRSITLNFLHRHTGVVRSQGGKRWQNQTDATEYTKMPALKRKRNDSAVARRPLKRPRSLGYKVASRRSTLLSRANTLLRTQQGAILRYHEDVSLNPTTGGIPAVYLFSTNGLYDPNITGTGHQPRGFDQMMSLYDHYFVDEAVIEVWAMGTETSSGYILSCAVKDGTSTITRRNVMEETVSNHVASSGYNGGPATAYLRLAVKPYQYLGLSMNEAELKGSNVANPSEQAIFSLTAMPINPAIDISELRCVVKITYKARFIEPKTPGES